MIFTLPEKLNIGLEDAKYAALDLETTGLSFKRDEIVEIGIVVFKKGKRMEEFESFIKPSVPISRKSKEIHGIDEEMLRNAPVFEDVVVKVEEMLRDSVIIGHNLYALDLSMLNKQMKLSGRKPFYNPSIDIYLLSRRLMGIKKRSLRQLSEALRVSGEKLHRALPDARRAMKIWIRFLEKLLKDGFRELSQFFEVFGKKGEDIVVQIFDEAEKFRIVEILYGGERGGVRRKIEPLGVRGGKMDVFCNLVGDFITIETKKIIKIV